MQEATIACLQGWAKANKLHADFELFVFGSIVEDGGLAFQPKSSDIDLALCLREADLDYLDRARLLRKLRDAMGDLEVKLLRLYKRGLASKAITSVVVLTPLERRLSLHKGGDGKLLSFERFIQITPERLKGAPQLVAISPHDADPDFDKVNGECAAALRDVQAWRNKYLKQAPNSEMSLGDFDDDDPLPKELMRHGAKVLWSRGDRKAQAGRESLAKGLEFVTELIRDAAGGADPVRSLADKLTVRRGGRGDKQPLTADEQLLAWEMLFDASVSSLKPTFDACLQKILAADQSTPK